MIFFNGETAEHGASTHMLSTGMYTVRGMHTSARTHSEVQASAWVGAQ